MAKTSNLRATVGIVLLACLAVGFPVGAGAKPIAAAHSPCFGAASRDPYRPCHDSKLALAVVPTPSEAQIMPNTPCAPIEATVNVCTFGVPAAAAAGSIALVGDSHAWHWRGAVEVVAQALGWQGLSSTRSSCPFTLGMTILSEPKQTGCTEWNRGIPRWLGEHPEVSTVFTSDHPGPVRALAGESLLDAQVSGVTAAWEALPASVKHIIVIRDIPYVHEDTLTCIERATSRRQDAGLACAVPRSGALHKDPDVVAAQRLHSLRVQVIDLTRFFCDSRLCYPVVGGALVYRDADHLTSTFATSVGPFLLHSLGRLMQSWG